MAVTYTASAVIAEAKKWVGYLEKASNASLASFNMNAGKNNYTFFSDYIDNNCSGFYNGKKQGQPWCDVFNDFCHIKAAEAAGGTWRDAMTALCAAEKSCGAGCEYSYNYFKAKGRTSKTPSVGAQIFFYDSTGDIGHTGIVYNYDENYVYTIEGNTSSTSSETVISNGGCCAKRKYARTNSKIAGYGLPIYGTASTASTTTSTTTSTTASSTTVSTAASKPSAVATGTKTYKNGSTDEPVFQTSDLSGDPIGSLNPYETCSCFGVVRGAYLVAYKVDGTECTYKCGYVAYSGGVKFS